MKTLIATSNTGKYEVFEAFFRKHNIKTQRLSLKSFDKYISLEEEHHQKLALARATIDKEWRILLETSRQTDVVRSVLTVIHGDGSETSFETITSNDATVINLSKYVLKFHQKLATASNRPELLREFLRNGNVAFDRSPLQWMESNPLFQELKKHEYYKRFVSYAISFAGAFVKVHSLQCEKNYWYVPLNGGLPVVKKKDVYHEGTYLLHDLYHFAFGDLVITGQEDAIEAKLYVAYRMMSEAFSLVAADMFGVAHAGLESKGYNTSARQIFPVIKSSNLDLYSLRSYMKMMYTVSTYCLIGNDELFYQLGAGRSEVDAFKHKYSRFFSVDYEWNLANLANFRNGLKANPNLAKYNEFLRNTQKFTTTSDIIKKASIKEGKLSFDRIFLMLWQRLVQLIEYRNTFSDIEFLQASLYKYVVGQMIILFLGKDLPENSLLALFRKLELALTKESRDVIMAVYSEFSTEFNRVIDILLETNQILPHEGSTYKLHVPHFQPVYGNYDRPIESYRTLTELHNSTFGDDLIVESGLEGLLLKHISEDEEQRFRQLFVVPQDDE